MIGETRLLQLLATSILPLGLAFGQSGGSGSTGRAIYFLRDDARRQWCGYASQSRFKAQVQPLRAEVFGKVDYRNSRVSRVYVTETDETGDWAVNDEYSVDDDGKLRTLKRTINILPEGTSEEQLFAMENGKANRRRSTYHELRSGRPTEKHVDWFEAPPVIASPQEFPFFALIAGKQQSIWSGGEVCVPDGSK
jgi:hypothetical protein